jgi:hypothetical protein
MLTIRRRGSAGKWYVRGTVSLDDRFIEVREFCTGTANKSAARHVMLERERCLREELMFGPRVVAGRSVIADAFAAYLAKPKRPHSSDVLRVGVMNEVIGAMPLVNPKAAWRTFQDARLVGHAPAGQDRYRSLLQAAINVWQERHDLPPIKLKPIPFDNQRIRFLSHAERDRLIEAYVPHVRPIATMFAFQGPRTQEALQLLWGAGGVDLARGTIFCARTKTGNRGASRSIRGSRRCCGRYGRSAVVRTAAMCSSTAAASPIRTRATSRSRAATCSSTPTPPPARAQASPTSPCTTGATIGPATASWPASISSPSCAWRMEVAAHGPAIRRRRYHPHARSRPETEVGVPKTKPHQHNDSPRGRLVPVLWRALTAFRRKRFR